MTDAQKVTLSVQNLILEGYQLSETGELVFTHRQIGEIIGKTKATAQNFLKKQSDHLPVPIKATIPQRKGLIP